MPAIDFPENILKLPRKQPFVNKGDIYTQIRMLVEVHLPKKIHFSRVVSRDVCCKQTSEKFGHLFSSWQERKLFLEPRIYWRIFVCLKENGDE